MGKEGWTNLNPDDLPGWVLELAESCFMAGWDAACDSASPPGPIAYSYTSLEAWKEFRDK